MYRSIGLEIKVKGYKSYKIKRFEVLLNIFFEAQLFRLDMPAAAEITVPHSIESIFIHFIACIMSYLGDDITNVGLRMFNCLWFLGITLFFNGALQEIVQLCQSSDF